jgi:hypothetical protein
MPGPWLDFSSACQASGREDALIFRLLQSLKRSSVLHTDEVIEKKLEALTEVFRAL